MQPATHKERFKQPGYHVRAKTIASQGGYAGYAREESSKTVRGEVKSDKAVQGEEESESDSDEESESEAESEDESESEAESEDEEEAKSEAQEESEAKSEAKSEAEEEVESAAIVEKEKQKSRKRHTSPRPRRSGYCDILEKLGSSELYKQAEDFTKAIKPKPKTGKESRYISARTAYKILGSVLTNDPSKSLLHGKVFFDPCAFKNPAVSSWHYKFLPYNARELGVEIGTNIRVGSVKGTVKSVMHNDVFVEFDGGERVKKNVLFVLEHAVENQNVTSLEQARRKFILDLAMIIALTHIFAPIAIGLDTDRTHKDNLYHSFPKEIAALKATLAKYPDGKKARQLASLERYRDDVKNSNSLIWSVLCNIPARDAIRVVPESFSPDLKTFIDEPGSLVEMLGFQHLTGMGPGVPETETGIFGNNTAVRCEGNAANFINDLEKHLQEASMLGRFLNFQSITAPLTTGEFDIVYENAKCGKEELLAEKTKAEELLYAWKGETGPTITTKATEAILCLGGRFIPSIPLGALKMLTRETGGKLKDGSTEGCFANIQKVDPLRQRSMPDGDKRDSGFFLKVSEYLHPISIEKRAAAEKEKQMNGQGGYTSKERGGKIHVDVKETHGLMNVASDTICEGYMKEFVGKFKGSELELGKEILLNRGEEGVGTSMNEDHLYTEETKAIARRVMDEEGVTCEYASEVTKMMFLLDRFLSIPIRRGTHAKLRAQDTFLNPKEKDCLGDYIRGRIKDDRGRQKLSFIHWKHAKITDAYVLMVVFLRAVLRLNHGDQIDPEIFPLDSMGRKMDNSNRRLLMKTAGKWFLGLPAFSEHVLRNVILTMGVYVVIEAGKDPETNPVIQHMLMMTHTTMKILMTHYDEDRNARAAKGVSMYDIKDMFKGSSSSTDIGTVVAPVVGSGKEEVRSGALAAKELAAREKALAEKEASFAAKELAAREKALAEKEASFAAKGASPWQQTPTWQQAPPRQQAAKESSPWQQTPTWQQPPRQQAALLPLQPPVLAWPGAMGFPFQAPAFHVSKFEMMVN